MKTLFWRSLVVVFVILGFIGALLPGMPTTVFLILAAWAASKGWPQMDAWLLNHPKYGPTLRAWRENGTVPRKAKWFASIMMFVSGLIMLFTSAPIAVKIFTDLTMLIVGIWLWTRPEPNQMRTIEQSPQTKQEDKDKQKEQKHV
ncbi:MULTISPECIES: YbaN family protein [unclassified Acinetobacter]|uniref:YbaN family protein n=1 Tax=Acinetobacter TaxID=469 RepID=UPI0015D17B3F|nr:MULTISPECIES: YbaN family protein [unclassified Acinetobacter]